MNYRLNLSSNCLKVLLNHVIKCTHIQLNISGNSRFCRQKTFPAVTRYAHNWRNCHPATAVLCGEEVSLISKAACLRVCLVACIDSAANANASPGPAFVRNIHHRSSNRWLSALLICVYIIDSGTTSKTIV